MTLFAWRVAAFLPILFLAACGVPGTAIPIADPSTVAPTLTPFAPPAEPGPVPSPLPTLRPGSADDAVPTPAIYTPARPQYILDVDLDYDGRVAEVAETIIYPNQTGQPLDALTLAVEANLYPSTFHLRSLLINDRPAEGYVLSHQRLDLPLPRALEPGGLVTISITYRLDLPWVDINVDPDRRGNIFGWTSRQINLTEWYPFVAPFEDGEWTLHAPWSYGEWLVYDAADFDVTLRLAPGGEDVLVAAGGREVAPGRWRSTAGRTFAFSLSRDFVYAETLVGAIPVRSYYFPEHAEAGQMVLATAANAVTLFSDRFAPYPYDSLSAVEGLHCESMEYSGFYFINRDLYSQYIGTPDDFLVVIAAHETAHQWWFGLVGNDQAYAPWLDEALATYSERIFYESVYPDLQDSWWWEFRLARYPLEGWVDTTLYDSDRVYRYAVYLRGASFLHELRARVGDEAFFAFLSDYAARHTFGRATTADFFAILGEHSNADLSDLKTLYFHAFQ